MPTSDLAHADIGLVCALALELSPFFDRCDKVRKYSGGKFVFRGGRFGDIRIVNVQTRVGFAKVRQATQSLIEAHTPPWVVSTGFCGGLLPEMKVGDIVMADSLVDTHGHELTVDFKPPLDQPPGMHVGRLVTTDEMVRTVKAKQELADAYGAVAVDMESLAVAQVCRETKTRFLAVRAVSDDLSADLPPEVLSVVGSSGSIRIGAALGAVWKRPGSVKEMWQLHESARKAAERLAAFLEGVVVQLYDAKH